MSTAYVGGLCRIELCIAAERCNMCPPCTDSHFVFVLPRTTADGRQGCPQQARYLPKAPDLKRRALACVRAALTVGVATLSAWSRGLARSVPSPPPSSRSCRTTTHPSPQNASRPNCCIRHPPPPPMRLSLSSHTHTPPLPQRQYL